MEAKRISILVKFKPDQLAFIDDARGEAPRMAWIVDRCMSAQIDPHKPMSNLSRKIASLPAKSVKGIRGFALDGSPLGHTPPKARKEKP
jgi:hypothetical protein